MTNQVCEELQNDCPLLDLGRWHLYGVIRGEPSKENHGWGDRKRVYRADPGPAESVTTANWKGFRERWRLTPEGRLVLVGFEYDDVARPARRRTIGEVIEGSFYIVLKTEFEGPRMYVAFRDGTLVVNQGDWRHEDFDAELFLHDIHPGPHPHFLDGLRMKT
jgi:hypothetical protein